jgi:hypothetical protein
MDMERNPLFKGLRGKMSVPDQKPDLATLKMRLQVGETNGQQLPVTLKNPLKKL